MPEPSVSIPQIQDGRKNFSEKHVALYWAKINKNGSVPQHCPELGPCYEWTACCFKWYGYGMYTVNCKKYYTHRYAWELHNGAIPDGLCVLHKCDNPLCSRISHLWVGTHLQNMQDMNRKNRGLVHSGPTHYLHLHPEKTRRGEQLGHTKLTTEIVLAIRAHVAAGNTKKSAAIKFNTSQTNVNYIITRYTWKHI